MMCDDTVPCEALLVLRGRRNFRLFTTLYSHACELGRVVKQLVYLSDAHGVSFRLSIEERMRDGKCFEFSHEAGSPVLKYGYCGEKWRFTLFISAVTEDVVLEALRRLGFRGTVNPLDITIAFDDVTCTVMTSVEDDTCVVTGGYCSKGDKPVVRCHGERCVFEDVECILTYSRASAQELVPGAEWIL